MGFGVGGGRLPGAADGAGAADLRAARLPAAPGLLARLHARHRPLGMEKSWKSHGKIRMMNMREPGDGDWVNLM